MATQGRALSPAKRVGGFLLLAGVMVAAFLLVASFHGMFSSPNEEPQPGGVPGVLAGVIVGIILGLLFFVAATVFYATVLLTHCFTFDFTNPYFKGLKAKLYIVKIAFGVFSALSLGFFATVPLTPLLRQMGLREPLPFILPVIATVFVVQMVLVWVNAWTPVERALVRKRAVALGLDTGAIRMGTPVGISDPSRSSFKKMTLVEDDVGLLWLEPSRLVYKGDATSFTLESKDVLSIERRADAGSMAAYAGGVYPIIRYRDSAGTERSVRFHAWGFWTLGAVARGLRELSSELESWHTSTLSQSPASDG